jgi:hypothetical protein
LGVHREAFRGLAVLPENQKGFRGLAVRQGVPENQKGFRGLAVRQGVPELRVL